MCFLFVDQSSSLSPNIHTLIFNIYPYIHVHRLPTPSDNAVKKAMTKEELARHCKRKTRGGGGEGDEQVN